MKHFLYAFLLIGGLVHNSFAQNGESLFKANCGICHTVGKGKLVGPDLKDVTKRRDESWLLKWITSSQTLVKAGDTTAVRLFEENGKLVMPDAPIAEADIKTVIGFIKEVSEKPVAAEPVAQHGAGVNEHNKANALTHAEVQDENGNMMDSLGFGEYIMMFLILLLLVILWVVILLNRTIAENAKLNSKH